LAGNGTARADHTMLGYVPEAILILLDQLSSSTRKSGTVCKLQQRRHAVAKDKPLSYAVTSQTAKKNECL